MFDVVSKATYVLHEEGVENFVLRLSRRTGLTALRDYVLYQRWGFDRDGSDFTVTSVDIDPSDVVYTQQFPFDVRGEDAIVGEGSGTWHRCVRRFDQSLLFRALHDRFVGGKPWEETTMYRTELQRLRNEGRAWNNCTTPAEVRERCEFVDELYHDIRENGYRSQTELRSASEYDDASYAYREANGVTFPDELRVAIGPDGQLIRVAGGRHRLAIAKLLEIQEIPAVVQIVHEAARSRLHDSSHERESRSPRKGSGRNVVESKSRE